MLIANFAKPKNKALKGICKDFKFQVWVAFQKLPTFRGLCIFLFFLLFSFFSAQDSLTAKISAGTQIAVIGKAQIYSADESFNTVVNDKKTKLVAFISYSADEHTVLITSEEKTKTLSEEVKIARGKQLIQIDKTLLAQLEKNEKKAAESGISLKNPASRNFFYSGNSEQVNFIVPNSQNHSLNSHLVENVEFRLVLILIFNNNNFYFNTRSKTFGYSKTYSSRPPPCII